jgi:hypothetical protein
MYSYHKVKFEIKITWRFYDSYVSFDETRYTLLLHDVYEVLILFFWLSKRVEHNNLGPINLDTEQDPVKAVETYI